MMLRDWEFRRQMLPLMILPFMGLASMYASGFRIDPFSGRFTLAHILPHIFGTVLFFICIFLPYGSDYKGA
jgi:predicted permease